MIKTVVKRSGVVEKFDAEKLNNWGIWAAENLDPSIVNWSGVVMRVVSTMPEEVTTKQLQDALIKHCLDKNTYEHNLMAGRLYAASLPKDLYKNRRYPHIRDLHKTMSDIGIIVYPNYTDEEYDAINNMLRHERDLTYAHYSINQIVNKMSLQNKKTKQRFESPQFVYMRVVMQTFNFYKENDRLEKIEELYNLLSNRKINVPTPYFTNSLTKNSNVSSCSLFTCDDTAESIGVMNTLTYMMTVSSAGLGVHFKTRSINDPVRGGAITHLGKVPYYRGLVHTIKSSLQACYDDKTEIMTENGWKLFKDLTDDDKVAQVDNELNITYVKPTRIINEPYSGEMYHFDGEMKDLLVTPNHMMVANWNWLDTHKFRADEYNEQNQHDNMYIIYDEEGYDSFDEDDNPTTDYFSFSPYANLEYKKVEGYDSTVHCVEVPTGMVLVRRNGKAVVGSNSRGGASTIFYPYFDPEIMALLRLKNPMTPEASRLRQSDYAMSLNKWFMEQAAKKKDVYLFSYMDAPELYEKFYSDDVEGFGAMMEEFAVNNPDKVTAVPAMDVLKVCLTNSLETGRVYLHFADESNKHTPYKETIYSSNLCCIAGSQEIMVCYKDNPDMATKLTMKDLVSDYDKYLAYSYNEKTRDIEKKPIVAGKLMRKDSELVKITLTKQGIEIICTPDHKIFTHNRGYVEASELNAADILNFGGLKYVEKFTVEPLDYKEDVYDIEVEDNHNFYINSLLVSNCEISLPTKPFKSYIDLYDIEKEDNGLVAFCNLAGILVDNIESEKEYEKAAYYALLMIDEGIENSDLPFPVLNKSIREYRSAGVGIIGLAHLMAKNGMSYTTQEGKDFIHNVAETHAYYLYKAALQLAKERGVAPAMDKTRFPQGWLPIDTYNKNVDSLITTELKYDWEELRKEIVDVGGIRFTTVSAHMPSESCLDQNTVIQTSEGTMSLHQILKTYTDETLESLDKKHDSFTGGGWYKLKKPIQVLMDNGEYGECDKIWYNGVVPTIDITLEDGSIIKATANHKLLVETSTGERIWKIALDIEDGDEIVEVSQ